MVSSSMTGYGAGQRQIGQHSLSVEAKSVNHRYLETSVRGPRWSLALEGDVRDALKTRFARGRFDVYIHLAEGTENPSPIDLPAARSLVDSLNQLRETLGIPGQIDLSLLASFRDVLRGTEPVFETEDIRGPLLEALGEALDALEAMRLREGEALERDILGHLDNVKYLCGEIRMRVPEAREALTARLRERLTKLSEGIEMDTGRLEQELVFAAERGDISEELSRLESHIAQFRTMLADSGASGRKLDFLVQEMNREANTIASKSLDLTLTQRAVDLKSALEKIREQIQNVE